MLPEEIRKQIIDMKNCCGKTVSEISKTFGAKYDTVRFIVKSPYEEQNVERGRPRKVNAKSKKTINECLKQSKHRYKQVRQSVSLSETEKAKRIEVVKNWIFQGISFSKVIFTGEKRFCLDGPDNYYSWINGDEHLTR